MKVNELNNLKNINMIHIVVISEAAAQVNALPADDLVVAFKTKPLANDFKKKADKEYDRVGGEAYVTVYSLKVFDKPAFIRLPYKDKSEDDEE